MDRITEQHLQAVVDRINRMTGSAQTPYIGNVAQIGCYHLSHAYGGLVAECTNGFDGDDGWVMADKAAHIARLVAAAPELLSSAENFLKWFRVFVGESGFAKINCEELRTLQDAIAKASEAA